MKEKTMRNIIEWTIGIVMFAALIAVVNSGIKKSEKRECQKWQEWEERYPHFTASKSMKKQCENYNIELVGRWGK